MPDPNINTAQTQFWSLALQREIAPNTLVELDYSGAHGVHLYDLENINLIGAGISTRASIPRAPACAGEGTPNGPGGNPICLVPPNEQYSSINMRGSKGSSAYDALNVKFQTQDLHHTGLTLVANYTWAHSLDDLSSTFGPTLKADPATSGVSDTRTSWTQAGLGKFGLRCSAPNRYFANLGDAVVQEWRWLGGPDAGWLDDLQYLHGAHRNSLLAIYDESNFFNGYGFRA